MVFDGPRGHRVVAGFLVLGLCAVTATGVAESEKPILVYAGAGFRLPVEEAARIFTEREGVEVETTFAGSGCLLAQAELAGRGDVFIPGEYHYLEQAQNRGLAQAAYRIAYLRPVIAVPKGNPYGIMEPKDLTRPGLRIGLGDQVSVAVGLAAERWLAAVLDPPALAAVHDNVRTRAINVNELGSQLSLAALDAAVVWDATVPLFDRLEAVVSQSSADFRTVITGSVLTMSRRPAESHRFLAYLVSEEGASVFRRFGYEPYASGSSD